METCSICGKKISGEQGYDYYIMDDGEIIGHCCRHMIRRCGCGRFIRNEKQRCNECEEKIYKNHINGYCTKPVGVFKNYRLDTTKPINHMRYYGIEMEFNNCNPRTVWCEGEKKKLYSDKWLYNKSDSSISSGVEVVTSPMDRKSIKYLLENMTDIFNYLNTMKKCDIVYNAGIHIHVSKNSISIPDRYKLGMLMNNSEYIDEFNTRLFYYLAGRLNEPSLTTSFQYNYCKIGTDNRLNSMSTGHGVAFNTGNNSTLEFRIFKSSTDVEVIKSYVELVDKMIEFCHVTGIKGITINNFILWLKDNTKNKVILTRISEFEDKVGKINTIDRKFVINLTDLLKGISWQRYPQLINSLNDNSNLKRAFRQMSAYNNTMPKYYSGRHKELIDRLIKTIKITAMNYILHNQERIEIQCA